MEMMASTNALFYLGEVVVILFGAYILLKVRLRPKEE